jgi:uncharacterized protein involved in exopolysaccharide biosynthesis
LEQNNPRELESSRFDQFEDEIELMDYLKVLWKWKYLILVGTLVCAIGAAVVSLNMTKVYGITTVLQPGLLRVTQDGKPIYIDSVQNMKAIIETNAFNGDLLKNINTPNKDDVPISVSFKATIPKGTNALEVLYETPHVNIGAQIIKNLNKLLLNRYAKRIESYNLDYDGQIRSQSNEMGKILEKIVKVRGSIDLVAIAKKAKLEQTEIGITTLKMQISENQLDLADKLGRLDNDIANGKSEMEATKKENDMLKQGMPSMKLEIDRISKNTDLLLKQRSGFLTSTGKGGDVLSALVYSNTIQQNISYLNTLRGTINDMTSQIYRKKSEIEKTGIYIKDLQTRKETTRKQTELVIGGLQMTIRDLEAQKENLKRKTKIEVDNLKSTIIDLQNDKKFKSEEIKSIEFIKNNIQNIQIIKQPKGSPSPIKPKTRLNVMLAGVVGLFLTVFLAFFVEYISKYNSREDEP